MAQGWQRPEPDSEGAVGVIDSVLYVIASPCFSVDEAICPIKGVIS